MVAKKNVLGTLLLASTAASRFQHDPTAQQRAREGKEQLERITTDPSARGCWASAVQDLEAGCKGMDDAHRSKLAVQVRTPAVASPPSMCLASPPNRPPLFPSRAVYQLPPGKERPAHVQVHRRDGCGGVHAADGRLDKQHRVQCVYSVFHPRRVHVFLSAVRRLPSGH